jgi:periplasmic divalent cation tolerance protein
VKSSRPVVVFVTTPPGRIGQGLARSLVEKRLAACVNIIPRVDSVYRWKGKLERSKESLLVIKTSPRRLPGLIREIRKTHPYDLPEIIALPVAGGDPDYLRWVTESLHA